MKRNPLAQISRAYRRFNQWYLRFPTTPRRLLVLECISAATISLVMLLVITLSNPHLRYKNQLLTWCVEYPVFFSFVQAPHNYKKARRMAALAPDRLERVARVVERALVSVLIGAVASLVLFAGAVHGSTALRLFPIFATMAFGILLFILEPSEGVNRRPIPSIALHANEEFSVVQQQREKVGQVCPHRDLLAQEIAGVTRPLEPLDGHHAISRP